MEISFHGADRGVTGSCHLLSSAGKQILIDCGLYQGSREIEEENNEPLLAIQKRLILCSLPMPTWVTAGACRCRPSGGSRRDHHHRRNAGTDSSGDGGCGASAGGRNRAPRAPVCTQPRTSACCRAALFNR